jgi:hypothetical protein
MAKQVFDPVTQEYKSTYSEYDSGNQTTIGVIREFFQGALLGGTGAYRHANQNSK